MQGKENSSCSVTTVKESGDLGTGNMMEFELIDQSGKRRSRPPLEDISSIVENVKRTWVGREVMALGKLMAQELGSAAAAGQPHQEQ